MKRQNLRTFAAVTAALGIAALALAGCPKPEPDDGNHSQTPPQNQTPAAADYDIGNLSQTAGNVTAVTVTPKQGKSAGAVTVYYNGATALPSGNGAYAVTFDVAAASGWNTATGLNAGTLRISDAINSLDALAEYLSGKTANTATAPYYIALKIANESDFATLRATLNSAEGKYVCLDLSGSTVTSIPERAFWGTASPYGCATLAGITIPDSVTSIGSSAFRDCASLASVTIGNGVTSIGSSAFVDCTSLTSVSIPDTVTSIESAAFGGCTSLASVTIGSGVTSTNNANPFPNCTSLAAITVAAGNTAYTADNGILYTKDKTALVGYPAGKTGASFTIPDTVTSIVLNAFHSCTGLASVTIPASVTSIGGQAFRDCTGLASVTFQGAIAEAGFNSNAFYGLGDLRSKFYATDASNGTPGTYTTTAPVSDSSVWAKQ